MPHFTVEYSVNLKDFDAHACLKAATEAMVSSNLFDEPDIKCRAYGAKIYHIGSGAVGHAFISGTLAILEGRSQLEKEKLADLVLQALVRNAQGLSNLHVQVSMEIVEIQRSSYTKAHVVQRSVDQNNALKA